MAWNTPGSRNNTPRGGNDRDVDAFLNRLRGMLGLGPSRGSGGFNPVPWIIGLVVLVILFNSFKLMDERQRGVVLRFGEFNRIMQPGANLKWPWPIETVYVVDATEVLSLSGTVRVLTRDENLIDISYNAQYSKTDPRLFLFGSRDPETTLQQAAESAVREVVGNNSMDKALFERSELVIAAQQGLQEALDFYQTGLQVTEFNLQDARPPEEVKQAFDDAISAREDKNRIENEARAFASKIVPEARGVAARLRTEAQGYRDAAIARAEGDARRFTLLVEQYRKAPEVTRQRLYLETMQQVLTGNQKVVAGGENNILYLPLNSGASGASPAVSPDAPLMRLPPTQALPPSAPADTRPERDARADGRQGAR